ncbi:right-handed parallel beta-helix repeat-containing protein [Bacillus thuringiensis]|uniref:right-handed parallel beta-helix repeat-containing protein n=1 Tax=Bacillus cereus group TaxID=86661 RepID=UPI003A859F48
MADAPKLNGNEFLDESYYKINMGIDNANAALNRSLTAESNSRGAINIANDAVNVANNAKLESKSVQEQLNNIVIEGDSSVEAAQARVDENGVVHDTLKERLDLDSLKVGSLLDLGTTPRSLARSLSEREINVKDFGAKGDGISDDTTPTQNAINYLSTLGGGIVRIPSGKFKINSSINIPSNIQLLGVGHSTIIDATGLSKGTSINQVKLFKIEGNLDTISTTPTSNINALSVSIPVLNVNGFKQNDMILVSSDEPYAPGTANLSWRKGEIQIVKGVTDFNLDLSGAMLFGYDYTQNGKVNRINVVENVVLSNMKLVLGGIGNAHNAISCRYARNVLIDNLIIEDAEDTSINLFYCYNCTIRRNTISNSTSPTPLGNTGYGIGVLDACRELQIYENTLSNCRHGVAGGGSRPSVLIQVFNNKAYGCRINFAYDCHEPCFYWSFRGNLADGCNGGIVVRGQYIVIENNDIINSTGKGIRVESYTPVTNQFGITIRNNRIKYCQDIGIDIDGYQSRLREVIVQGNVIDGTVTKGINLYNFQSGEVSNNYVLNTAGIGIYAGGNRSNELTMRNNTVNYSNSANIYLESTDRILFTSNKTKNSTTREGLYASSCNELQIEGGLFRDSYTYGIYINGGNKHSISNARCSVTADSNGDGARVLNVTDLSINGGTYDGNPRFGIYISGSNFIVVRGVNARNNSNANKINIDENATNKIVDGNLI